MEQVSPIPSEPEMSDEPAGLAMASESNLDAARPLRYFSA